MKYLEKENYEEYAKQEMAIHKRVFAKQFEITINITPLLRRFVKFCNELKKPKSSFIKLNLLLIKNNSIIRVFQNLKYYLKGDVSKP